MAWIYDTGEHQLTTQNSLHFVSICHLHPLQELSWESYVAVYLKVLSMQLLSHGGTGWLQPPNPKKHQHFFSSRKDLQGNSSQQKTLSSYKRYIFIIYILCFHASPSWGLFNEEKILIYWIAVAIVLHKNCFVFKINHLWWFSTSP